MLDTHHPRTNKPVANHKLSLTHPFMTTMSECAFSAKNPTSASYPNGQALHFAALVWPRCNKFDLSAEPVSF